MSTRFSILLLESLSGGGIDFETGADVDLYVGSNPNIGVDSKTDFTEIANKGIYYVDVTTSGIYTVVVDGVIQANLQGIFIDAGEGKFNKSGNTVYLVMDNEDAEETYIYPNDTQDGIIVDSTEPT